jgi:NAD(P)-dependent dehydrogenase (short-subunit alcohol dehydrogenase family)
MTDDLIGKVAIVTGAGQGIGKGIAKRLLEEGMSVVIADVDAEAGAEAAAELEAFGSVLFKETDVADEAQVARLVEATLARFEHLDALINNAGLANPDTGPLEALSLADWNRRLGSNLTGAFLCSKHAIPALRRSHGAIANIASTRALQSEPHSEAYAASKGGLVALTHAMAISLGPAIRVNCISPGWIAVADWRKASKRAPLELRPEDHAQHPVGRVGRPEDVAELVTYLISPRSGFVTGQNFVLDGGMTRKMIYLE